jgi:putative ATP-binding cassette transporter
MKLKIFKLIAFFMKYSRTLVLLSIATGILAGASSAILMMLINARLAATLGVSVSSVRSFIVLAALLLIATTTSGFISNLLAQSTSAQLRMYLCRKVLSSPLRRIEEAGPHNVMAALTQDITTIIGALLRVPGFFINSAIVIGGMLYLGWLSSTMLILLVGFVILAVASYILPQKTANRYIHLAREEYSTMVDHFRALLLGGKELRLHRPRRAAFFAEVFEPTAISLRRYSLYGDGTYVLLNSWSQVLYFIIIGLILFGLPGQLGVVSLKTLTGYALTVLYISGPIQALVNIVPAFSQANVALRKLEELGLTLSDSEIDDVEIMETEPVTDWHQLEFAGITHSYYREQEASNFVLGPIDLTVKPGELLFLVGGNGSGKTTFAKLLCGLYTPESGEVKLDGVPVNEKNVDDYRQYFSVVFTEFHVFEQLLGMQKVDLDDRAREYLVQLQLDKKVSVQDGKLSTTKLSYGQRKRLALLTAYLEDRPIYIFDEWAADQDPFFKDVFYNSILPSLKARGKAVIVISHDDRYYYVADRIVKLEYGKLVYDQYQKEAPASAAEFAAVSDLHLGASHQPALLDQQSKLASFQPQPVETGTFQKNGKSNGNGFAHYTSKAEERRLTRGQTKAPVEPVLTLDPAVHRKQTLIFLAACFLSILLVGLTLYAQRPPAAVSASAPPDQFSSGRAMQHLQVIAQQPHPIGAPDLANVGQYISKTLSDAGLTPQVQQAVVTRQTPRGALVGSVQNIVARLGGTIPNRKAVMLVAHYDSVAHSFGASDDGAGVVTLLETVRALKTGPPLQNDVIFLFTDGEEAGMLGAQAFVDEHPWAKDVGLVFNFEARGSGGPVYMFETSDKNGRLVDEFGKAAPHPFASSLMYTIYKLLPNDTDFTIFRRKGLDGFNFAYIGEANRYHTSSDSLQTIDERSLQHHGSYALALVRHFGQLDLANLRATDAIYFDVLGLTLINYSQKWAIPLALVVALLFVGTLVVGLRKRELTPGGTAAGLLLYLLSLASALTVVTLLARVINLFHGDYTARSNAGLLAAGLLCMAFFISTGLYLLFCKWTRWNNLVAGALGGWMLLAVLSSLLLPGASYLFVWPLLFSTLALLVSFFKGHGHGLLLAGTAILFACSIPGIVLMVSTIYNLFQGLALGVPAALVLPELLLLGLLLPYLKRVAPTYRWLLPTAAMLASIVFLFFGNIVPVHNQDNPKPDSIVYDLDADTGQATWVSNDRQPDEWTSQFFTNAKGNGAEQGQNAKAASGLLSSPAPALNLADEIKVLDDETTGQERRIHLHIVSPRRARVINLYVEQSAQVLSAVVNGKRLDHTASSANDTSAKGWSLSYNGVPPEGIDLVLETRPADHLKLRLGSYSDGLPEVPDLPLKSRPAQLMPALDSDMTHVSKSYDLGSAAGSLK